MAAKGTSYLIIGSGVFGVSTAYHLIQKYPTASVTLVDRDAYDAESRVAASWDWNKVVRADYDDKVYCQLALEAQDVFQSDPLWKPYFHQTGVYWICRSSYAQDVINHHKGFGRHNDIEALPVAQARKMFDGLFDNADYTGAKEVLLNKSSGWELGVKYVTAEVATLEFDGRRCIGAKTRDGNRLLSSHVIVSAGAFTPTLLEMSAEASGNEGLSAGSRILAAGITTGMAQLTAEQYQKFKNMPVGFQGYTPNEGLYIATCGSFHGYKFFPVLGKYITQMMEGELSPELADKWAWDRKRPDPSQNVEYPNTEANHLLERMTKL
ncbi:unnamed protein product [Parascedosporium putredinis]|uniref:FAD dependent oxidoreductase domain-containing protein n=1 Tax=Parascedosporium putredinis TaxID=1442378 RepID=A0A9P1MB70_9PEZI|nr:unnamed protein product [Parascedosporium putredinis]CAI7998944.1 unnamed protein product [Parascedosporium putredinis]